MSSGHVQLQLIAIKPKFKSVGGGMSVLNDGKATPFAGQTLEAYTGVTGVVSASQFVVEDVRFEKNYFANTDYLLSTESHTLTFNEGTPDEWEFEYEGAEENGDEGSFAECPRGEYLVLYVYAEKETGDADFSVWHFDLVEVKDGMSVVLLQQPVGE